MTNLNRENLASVALLSSALAWGGSGVLTQIALIEMTPMALIFWRFFLSAIMSSVFFKVNLKTFKSENLLHGLILSSLMIIIYISSTYGLKYTTASNAGFIIGTSVVLVPLFNRLIYKNRLNTMEYLSLALCMVGLSLVTLRGAKPLNIGDFFCFIDAIAYALYILYNSKLPKNVDEKQLISFQFIFVAIGSFIYLATVEDIPRQMSINGGLTIIVLAVFCTFIAFFVQLKAQRHITAERAGKILVTIPVFTVIFDYAVLGIVMSRAALVGGIVIILAILLEGAKMPLIKRR